MTAPRMTRTVVRAADAMWWSAAAGVTAHAGRGSSRRRTPAIARLTIRATARSPRRLTRGCRAARSGGTAGDRWRGHAVKGKYRVSRFRVSVHIVPRTGILDPQGHAVADALHTLGFGRFATCGSAGMSSWTPMRRHPRPRATDGPRDVRTPAGQPRDRGLRDRVHQPPLTHRHPEVTAMRFGIVTFPGSNSDIDAYQRSSMRSAKRR